MNWNYSCRKVSELVSQSLDEPLGVVDRVRLRLHLSMCDNCQNVERQMTGLHGLFSGEMSADDGDEETAPRTNDSPRRADPDI
jgi:predicted anti-sigma-YlaC factor YlaD